MNAELHKIEDKYQRISSILDQVPDKLKYSQAIVLEETERKQDMMIDSVDSQATIVDENDVANKDIFCNGIMQMFGKRVTEEVVPKNKKCVSAVTDTTQLQLIAKLKEEVERQKSTIKEYREFIVKMMKNIRNAADDSECQSRAASVRSFFQ